MKLKLREAVNVPGARCVAENIDGYDLFKIITWEAAQSFVTANSETPAGEYWCQNQTTFNSNISDDCILYFFTQANTNKVVAGVVAGGTYTRSNIRFVSNDEETTLALSANFGFESMNDRDNIVLASLPLYKIPDAAVNLDGNQISFEDGYVVENGVLVAVVAALTENKHTIIDTITHDPSITRIVDNARNFGVAIDELILSDTFDVRGSSIFLNDFTGVIKVTAFEKPENWPNNWCGHPENVEWAYGKSEEQKAEYRRNKEEAEAQARREQEEQEEAERRAAEEEAARKAEEERNKALSAAQKLRYRIEKNEVTILGARGYQENIFIPSEIDGKPVTKIAPYAFYMTDARIICNDYATTRVRTVGKGAFADSSTLEQGDTAAECFWVEATPNISVAKNCCEESNMGVFQIQGNYGRVVVRGRHTGAFDLKDENEA